MSPLERESLLLRQLAALRHRGIAHERALEMAREGLPAGPLAERVDAARRDLAAGGGGRAGGGDVLARGQAPTEALEYAAQAIDARLSADASLAMVRLYLTIGIAGLLVVGAVLGWVVSEARVDQATSDLTASAISPLRLLDEGPALVRVVRGWSAFQGQVLVALKYAGLPLAVVVAIVLRRAALRSAPGVGPTLLGATLLEAAASGADPSASLSDPSERAYLDARRQVVGASRAAAELAQELVHQGEHVSLLFRHLAPIAGAILAAAGTWLLLAGLGGAVALLIQLVAG